MFKNEKTARIIAEVYTLHYEIIFKEGEDDRGMDVFYIVEGGEGNPKVTMFDDPYEARAYFMSKSTENLLMQI